MWLTLAAAWIGSRAVTFLVFALIYALESHDRVVQLLGMAICLSVLLVWEKWRKRPGRPPQKPPPGQPAR
ncbi:MAG TPA: hypothetical protein VH025_02380 [Solirubrobacteraceae bacterium]|jgi:hypothetical protein|nr:hypothetical protein [Solirubrobacteraceae bacterium]